MLAARGRWDVSAAAPRASRALVVGLGLGVAFVAYALYVVIGGALTPPRGEASGGVASGAPAEAPTEWGEHAARLVGVRAGEPLGPATLLRVRAPQDRQLPLDFTLSSGLCTILIAAKGATQHLPPRSSARFDLFVSAPEGTSEHDTSALLEAVEQRVREREGRFGESIPF